MLAATTPSSRGERSGTHDLRLDDDRAGTLEPNSQSAQGIFNDERRLWVHAEIFVFAREKDLPRPAVFRLRQRNDPLAFQLNRRGIGFSPKDKGRIAGGLHFE